MEKVENALRDLWIKIVEELEKVNEKDVDKELLEDLVKRGYVQIESGEVRLTSRGLEFGRRIVRLHRLTERLLADVLDAKEEVYESEACKVEHIITPELERAICTLLGHPKVCPHGKNIPPGECCMRGEEEVERAVFSLYDLNPGDEGKVSYILMGEGEEMMKIINLGLTPGKKIRLIRKFPSYILQVGNTQLALDDELAKKIYVLRTPTISEAGEGRRERRRFRFRFGWGYKKY